MSKQLGPPHVERLVRRVQVLDAPLIQLWGWPGSGQQAVLDALVAEDPHLAQPISVEDLAEEGALRRAVAAAAAAGAHWLVLPTVPSLARSAALGAETIAGLLPAGCRLVFAAARRLAAGPLEVAYVAPQELLLDEQEIAALWLAMCDRDPAPRLRRALLRATDGWYRPLLQAAEAAAAGGLPADGLLALPPVVAFLRHEVLARLTAAEREMLDRLALADSVEPGLWRPLLGADERAALDRLIDVRGLAVERRSGGGRRLPALLRAFLVAVEPPPESAAVRRDLALAVAAAEVAAGHPAAALRSLLAAGDAAALRDLLAGGWGELLAEVPLATLDRALRLAAAGDDAVAATDRLLRAAVDALLWRRQGAVEELAGLAAGAGPPAAAAGLLAALVGAAPKVPAAPAPAALEPLELLAMAGGLPAGAGDEALATALAPALARLRRHPVGDPDLLARAEPGAARSRLSVVEAVTEDTLLRLAGRHPGLAAELRLHPEVPGEWHRRLAAPAPMPVAAPAAPGFAVELLGAGRVVPLAADRDGELSWPLRRAFLGFAYLVSSPALRAGRDELEEALWPGETEAARVRRNFHPTLSHLRRSLERGLPAGAPAPLLHSGGVYRLNPDLHWQLDSRLLEQHVEEGRERLAEERLAPAVALWERARELYRGHFLAPYDDPWVVQRRDRLQRLHLELLRSLGMAYARLDRVPEAVDALRGVLVDDPLQERVHQTMMRLYARQGRRDLVRLQYKRLTDVLRRELGIDPMDETNEIYHRLLA